MGAEAEEKTRVEAEAEAEAKAKLGAEEKAILEAEEKARSEAEEKNWVFPPEIKPRDEETETQQTVVLTPYVEPKPFVEIEIKETEVKSETETVHEERPEVEDK